MKRIFLIVIVTLLHARPLLAQTSERSGLWPKAPSGQAELGFEYQWFTDEKRWDHVAGLVLRLPFGRFAEPIVETSSSTNLASSDRPLERVVTTPDLRSEDVTIHTVDLSTADLRTALRAARWRVTSRASKRRVRMLSARARHAAWLPRLQIRATRVVDESSTVSPTSYDPDRRTYSGGGRTWLEARLAWSLDRLLFAGAELPFERMRQRIAIWERDRSRELIGLIARWRRAAFDARDSSLSWPRCRSAWLKERELALQINWLTNGWLEGWRKGSVLALRRPCSKPSLPAEEGELVD